MAAECLSYQEVLRARELAKNSYRPKEVLDLQKEIEGKTRVAELRFSVSGVMDKDLISEIVQMKLHLNGLYCKWIRGELS